MNEPTLRSNLLDKVEFFPVRGQHSIKIVVWP
jgi:hypothetical protein